MYANDVALVAYGAMPKEPLKNAETEANELAAKVRRLGLEIEPLKIEAIIYHGTRTESPIGEEIVIVGYTVKTSRKVKYLEIVLDNKLSFTAYIARRTVVG